MVLVSGQQMATQVCKRLPGGCGGAPGILILPELGLVTAQTNHHHQQRGPGTLGSDPPLHLQLDTYGQPEVQRKHFITK